MPGTPDAQSFSHLLLKHKNVLGNLYVSKVRVFRDSQELSAQPSLLMVVEPVPAGEDMGPAENEPAPVLNVDNRTAIRRRCRRRWWDRSKL